MDTITICKLACSDKYLKSRFGGVFASDTLPKCKTYFKSFIVNLDSKLLPGSHWIAIHFHKNTAYFFDSYGLPPRNKHIISFMKRNSSSIRYNSKCFQDDLSSSCGYFCLYYLYQSVRNKTLEDLDAKNKKQNEKFIKMFVKRRLFLSSCCHTFHKQKQKCIALINMTAG